LSAWRNRVTQHPGLKEVNQQFEKEELPKWNAMLKKVEKRMEKKAAKL